MENIDQIAKQSYDRYVKDVSIVGFDGILRLDGYGSKRRLKIRNRIYELYGKDNLIKIYRSRLAKSAHKNRTPESYNISPERRIKMADGIKKSWVGADDRREQNRKLMVKYCHPISWTSESNEKRKQSRAGYKHSNETIDKIKNSLKGKRLTTKHRKALCVPKIRAGSLGLKRSDLTKQKLSKITALQWKNGIHVPTYKSKGQIEVATKLKDIGFDVKEEFFIGSKPYDVFVPAKKLIIEFNGTFWHRDPRFYVKDEQCQKIWDYDKNKLDIARKSGYNVIVIWQYDWECCVDKHKFIEDIINGFN